MNMQNFVNEYEYTQDIMKESVGAWWDYKFKGGYRSMLVGFLLITIVAIVGKRPVLLLLEIIPVFVIVLSILKKKKAIQMEQERSEVLFRSSASCRLEVGGDISVTSPRGSNRIQFSDVENYMETKNLIVLLIKGGMTLAFDKNGFKEGTKDEFLSFLADKMK